MCQAQSFCFVDPTCLCSPWKQMGLSKRKGKEACIKDCNSIAMIWLWNHACRYCWWHTSPRALCLLHKYMNLLLLEKRHWNGQGRTSLSKAGLNCQDPACEEWQSLHHEGIGQRRWFAKAARFWHSHGEHTGWASIQQHFAATWHVSLLVSQCKRMGVFGRVCRDLHTCDH